MNSVERRLRILIAAPFPPRRDARHGGGRVTAALTEALAARHDVALLCFRAPWEQPADERLERRGVRVVEVPRPGGGRASMLAARARLLGGSPIWVTDLGSRAFAERLSQLAGSWRPDVVQLEYPVLAQYAPAARAAPGARVVLVEHDPAVRLAAEAEAQSRGVARLVRSLDHRAWRRFERRALAAVDAVVAFTEDDAAFLRRSARAPVVTIPFSTPVPDARPRPATEVRGSILFVGSYVHAPNVDAARWLASEIFPRVREALPGATLELVGHAPPATVTGLASDAVAVHADVPDVAPHLDRAAVVAAPIRMGGGMRVKVLEALAAGKAVVATRRAAAGLNVVDGRELLLAETARELAGAIAALLADDERRAALGERARAWAEQRAADPAVPYEELYRSLLERPR